MFVERATKKKKFELQHALAKTVARLLGGEKCEIRTVINLKQDGV